MPSTLLLSRFLPLQQRPVAHHVQTGRSVSNTGVTFCSGGSSGGVHQDCALQCTRGGAAAIGNVTRPRLAHGRSYWWLERGGYFRPRKGMLSRWGRGNGRPANSSARERGLLGYSVRYNKYGIHSNVTVSARLKFVTIFRCLLG